MSDLGTAAVNAPAAVLDLVALYTSIVDDGDLDAWVELFADDASYQVIGRENLRQGLEISHFYEDSKERIADRVKYIREVWKTNFNDYYQRHFVGPATVTPSDSGFALRMNVGVFITERFAGAEPKYVIGEYRDLVVAQDGAFRFAAKQVILDTEVLPRSLIYPI